MHFALRHSCASLAACLFAASAAPSAAETTRRVPEDFPTIGAAIAASAAGDEVLVGPGEYRESLLLTAETGGGIVLRSTEGSARTTIVYGDSASANGAGRPRIASISSSWRATHSPNAGPTWEAVK